MGDIGEQEEVWEVLPGDEPIEQPDPAPAPLKPEREPEKVPA